MHPLYGIPLTLFTAFAFVFGAAVGSFLNVVIARVPFDESIVWPPSHCMSCGTPIKPFHNVPVLSWFWLRGRCRTCLAPFSIRYAGIELLYGLVCALAVYRHGLTMPAAREILLMGFLIPLTFMDLDHYVLPRSLTHSGVVVGLVLALVEDFAALGERPPMLAGESIGFLGALQADWGTFLWRAFAASLGWSGLMVVAKVAEWVMKKEAMGEGDPPLVGLLGAFLGVQALLPIMLLSSLQAVAVGIPTILLRRRKQKEEEKAEKAGPDSAQEKPAPEGPTAEHPAPEEPKPEEPKPEEPKPEEPKPEEPKPEEPGPETTPAESGDEWDDGWTPDPTAIPYGPFLALAGAELLYFTQLPRLLFPWPF